jgi:5-methyltetrahydropteroyltriglutamate--homocysteine methyltransferase
MQLDGFDYERLAEKPIRGGRRIAQVGRCVGPVRRSRPIVVDDLRFLIAEARTPVKVTLPGPLTIADSIADEHYGDERALAFAVAEALNAEARALDALGPAVIQFDEPAFSRYPEKVADWGIAALDRCLEGLRATTAVHVCYSYPIPGVPRPIVPSYPVILPELEKSRVDQVALEFEAPQLDPAMLRLCPSKTVLFGCIAIGKEETETPERIAERLLAAARHHAPERLQAAPDCGLVPLSRAAARAKLAALAQGARLARKRL